MDRGLALALRERLSGPVHPGLIKVLGNIALVLQQQGQYAQALAMRMRALRISELQLGPWHPQLAVAMFALGRVLRAQGSYREAQDYYERALRIQERALGLSHSRVGSVLREMGSLYLEMGSYPQAIQHTRRALAITRAQPQIDEEEERRTMLILAAALRHQGLFQEALALQDEVVEKRRAAAPEHPGRFSSALVSRSLTRLMQKDYAGALRDAQQSVDFVHQHDGMDPTDVADAHQMLGRALLRLGKPAAALVELESAIKLREPLVDTGELGGLLLCSAEALITLNRSAEALPRLERALQLRGNRELGSDKLHANIHFMRAKALWTLERSMGSHAACVPALEALEKARTSYMNQGLAARAELEELRAWAAKVGCL